MAYLKYPDLQVLKPGSSAYQKAWRDRTGYSGKRKALWRERRLEVLSHYCGGQAPHCACCGEQQIEFLSLDHVDGGGNQHKRRIGRGWTLMRWLQANGYPDGYQVLCHNCNQAKGYYGVCPHQRQMEEVA